MNIEKIPSYGEVEKELLLTQYKNSPNINSLLEIVGKQLDDLETATFEVRDYYWLNTASGVQLDSIGEIFNVPRNGMDDDTYRGFLKVKRATSFSGTSEQVISVLLSNYGYVSPIRLNTYPELPATILVTAAGGDPIPQSIEEAIMPAGVQLDYMYYLAHGNIENQEDNFITDANGIPLFVL